jgi:uncharacterized protein (UPF0261 family)
MTAKTSDRSKEETAMDKMVLRITFLLIVIACLVSGGFLSQVLLAPTAQAQRGQSERKPKVAAYEYCAITGVGSTSLTIDKITVATRICYMRESGIQCEVVEATGVGDRNFDKVASDSLAKAIAKLGNEGWELIGKGLPWYPRGPEDATYFRRQKQ